MKLGINLELENDSDEIAKIESEKKSDKILKVLFTEYPMIESVFEEIKTACNLFHTERDLEQDNSWIFGRLMMNSKGLFEKLDVANSLTESQKNEITTELEANASDDVTCLKVDSKQQENYVLTHNFEKVETIDEFNGNWRDFDGDDSLSDQEDALRDLNLRHTVRVDDATHSVYKAEFSNSVINIRANDSNEERVYTFYDEWNYKKRNYLKNHCKLFHHKAVSADESYCQSVFQNNTKSLMELRKMFSQISNDLENVKRLTQGEEIDYDAYVNAFIDLKSKKPVDDKFYMSRLKRKKNLSILILLDNSLSTDGYSAGNRILDVEKEAVLMFGEVLSEYDIPFQIDTFSSRTRNHAVYTTIKSFKDKWSIAKSKIGAIQPENYTRIGTALRHAGEMLNKEENSKKWILMFSDGKPNDFDKYEGKYGVEDVKQALKELHKQHIHAFSFAIESTAKYYLPMMFGQSNYNILTKPSELPIAFARFYKKAIK